MTAKEIEMRFSYKQLQAYNNEIRSKYNHLQLQYSYLVKKQEQIVAKEVKERTKEYEVQLQEKDKQIEALKKELSKAYSKLDNDSTNSNLPTSQTPLHKKKYIPNTREKTNKKIGGQLGHKKHKLERFPEEEANEIIEVFPKECPNCGGKKIKKLPTKTEKCETDYEVVLIKRLYQFQDGECENCKKVFHEKIPKELKEENQYGTTLQSLCVCLTNEIYTPFNKTVKLVSGMTDGEINLSEGYVAKLQKRASQGLEKFVGELEEYLPKQPVYGWDEGVITVDTKKAVLRTYCTDKVVLFYGKSSKSKESIDEDGILKNTKETTIVMHDHLLLNYNENYVFENVECMIHLIRRLKKMKQDTHHEIYQKMIHFLSEINQERNKKLKEEEEGFSKERIQEIHQEYQNMVQEARQINEASLITENYYKETEATFLKDLLKYEKNYLKWVERWNLPSTNNNCERSIRPIKSKMKISGQFKNIEYASYYATIRSYLETCKRNGVNIILACKRLMSGNPFLLEEILEIGREQKKDTNLS